MGLMAETLADLRGMSEDELIAKHDEMARTMTTGLYFYVDELARRETARQTQAIVSLTRVMTGLTVVIALLTAANVVIAL
jgi:hypothetical protein